MSISIKIPFEELLQVIANLSREEKRKISEILEREKGLTKEHWNEAQSRKAAFEKGEIESEPWHDIKKRLLS